MEGTDAFHDASCHHTQRVEDGHTEHREAQTHHRHVGIVISYDAAMRYKVHAKHGHDDAHHHSSAIADEHLRRLAEHVVQEEGHQ